MAKSSKMGFQFFVLYEEQDVIHDPRFPAACHGFCSKLSQNLDGLVS